MSIICNPFCFLMQQLRWLIYPNFSFRFDHVVELAGNKWPHLFVLMVIDFLDLYLQYKHVDRESLVMWCCLKCIIAVGYSQVHICAFKCPIFHIANLCFKFRILSLNLCNHPLESSIKSQTSACSFLDVLTPRQTKCSVKESCQAGTNPN